MAEQLWLKGLEPPAGIMDHCFFAIVPPPAIAVRAVGVARWLFAAERLSGRLISQDCLHVTLHGVPLPRLVAAARGAAATVAMPPFEIAFDRAMSFDRGPRDRPLVLRASGEVTALAKFHRELGLALGVAMRRAGFRRAPPRGFTPHMTLLYDARLMEARPVEPVRWTVEEFVLVHSLVGQGRHVHLDRWPLRG